MRPIIHLYQYLRPLRVAVLTGLGISPSPCRHRPSCSQFALEAISRHGSLKGTLLGLRRLLSCHPFAHP